MFAQWIYCDARNTMSLQKIPGNTAMMRNIKLAAFSTLLAVLFVDAQAQTFSALEQRVSGTWRLIGSEQTLKDGSKRPNPVYGPNPVGYVMYDPTHHMCLFLTRSQKGETEPAPLGNGLNAYCGKWRIDSKTMTMYHETEMDVLPKRATIVREPKFELKDGRLYLHPPIEGTDVVGYVLIFEKVVSNN